MPDSLFCFGLGYSAEALAALLAPAGWSIAGTGRDPATRARLERLGYALVPFDRDRPVAGLGRRLAETTHLLVSVSPDEDDDPVLAVHGPAIAKARTLRWIGYLSTTGVYGDSGGAWVDEATPLRPGNARSVRRADAEAAWLALGRDSGLAVHVFRLAGIYGPGRSAVDQVRAGTARRIDKPGHAFSRIHVADIALALAASMARPNPGAIYNVCDDDPAPQEAVVAHACALLGVAPPPLVAFAEADLSPMARSFYVDNRRVRNDRLKRELGIRLRYPSYRDGLAAIAAARST
ncbi:MAG: SDR family oxidoreductase [Alphaproteobacteria bacterium]|nr:SDR family oxidoreductase [Alphaproteobacteria bacterium]